MATDSVETQPNPCIIPERVINSLPSLTALDRALLQPDFNPITFIDAQLAHKSAAELHEILSKHLSTLQENPIEVEELREVPSVDLSGFESFEKSATSLIQQARELDGRLEAVRADIEHVLRIRGRMQDVASLLATCSAFFKAVHALPSTLTPNIGTLQQLAYDIHYTQLLGRALLTYSEIPLIKAGLDTLAGIRLRSLKALEPIQPRGTEVAYWELIVPHYVLLSAFQESISELAETIIGIALQPRGATPLLEIEAITTTIREYQTFVRTHIPYARKLEYDTSLWLSQARQDAENLISIPLHPHPSFIIELIVAFIHKVRDRVDKGLKFIELDAAHAGAFNQLAQACIDFERGLRETDLVEHLSERYPELKEPLGRGLLAPLFSTLIASDTKRELQAVPDQCERTLASTDFTDFPMDGRTPPPKLVALLRGWRSGILRLSPFFDEDTRSLVISTLSRSTMKLIDGFASRLSFPDVTHPLIYNKYSRLSEIDIRHSLVDEPQKQRERRGASPALTIYDTTCLLVVPPTPAVISTICCVVWSIWFLESNVTEMLRGAFGTLPEEVEAPLKGAAEVGYDTGARTYISVLACELCGAGIYPLLDDYATGRQDMLRARTRIVEFVEQYCTLFRDLPPEEAFTEGLVPGICNAAGCVLVLSPSTNDALAVILGCLKELLRDLQQLCFNGKESRLLSTICQSAETKLIGVISFLLAYQEAPKQTTADSLLALFPSSPNASLWFAELVRHRGVR
ncbi:hypothetical protein GMRT_23226 [Giardia muris]|uniref:Uncharacterized protein n=1 Tax=Giardia muris TaxID=5742 RepID=A0A4Z1SP88_GIAMU|nr:hypothetical protein GMRT_23226 [Giardia muris]|eukprot:TNJ27632.1 hypothetical protein GMRT_23226 [Giardia muris]